MTEKNKKKSYLDFLPESGGLSEENLWQAIADANDLDYSEIADGDLLDWI